MDARIGWLLAVAALGTGWWSYGWPGLMLALTVIVFWLLLQFSRTMRVLRDAAGAPLGRVRSAVMFQARLRAGLPLADAIRIAGSLGRKTKDAPETFEWSDDGGARVEVEFAAGRCTGWRLQRAEDARSGGA